MVTMWRPTGYFYGAMTHSEPPDMCPPLGVSHPRFRLRLGVRFWLCLVGIVFWVSTAHAARIEAIRIRFAAQVGAVPFACGQSYSGIGMTSSTITPTDFRFFVSDVSLLRNDGTSVPVTLDQDGTWQYRNLALLDFEDGTGPCRNGNAAVNTEIRGSIPKGDYVGVRFTLGVPFDLNHGDPTLAPSPLNITSMFWVWKAGYRFLKIEMASSGQPDKRLQYAAGNGAVEKERSVGFPVHIGSAGCASASLTTPPTTACKFPNRATVTLDHFNPGHSVVVADLAALLKGSNVDVNTPNTAPGCMSEPADPDCVGVMQALGISGGAQLFFHLR